MATTLPPDYYRTNFCHLIDFVAERYGRLLSAEEKHYHQRFNDLPQASQLLYIRLLSRRAELFRQDKLHYDEIGDIEAAAVPLADQRLLLIQPELPLAHLLPLFTKAEIARRLVQPALKHLPRKELEQQLLEDVGRHGEILERLLAGETILQVLDKALFTTFKLCFFGNLRQDLTDYVLRDLGLQQFEDYPLDPDHLPFTRRDQIERHLQYYRCAEQLEDTLQGSTADIIALRDKLPGPDPNDPVLTRRLDRLCNTMARQLERLQEPQLALQLYRDVERPPARERSTRILIQQGQIEAGLDLCRQIAENPVNEEERIFAGEFGYRQAKRHDIPWPTPRTYQPPSDQLGLPVSELSVELAVAKKISANGPCYYIENALLNGVLGLLIWDIVFAPVRGAFFNPFQHAPADFYDAGFTARRKQALQQRLQQSTDQRSMKDIVFRHYRAKAGIANPLVNWSVLSEELLQLALQRIPVKHWLPMLRRLLGDLRHHRSGLPDLIAFPHEGGYQWIEVKGPGDRLQKNQLRWLAFFAEHDIPHRVIYVDWIAQHDSPQTVG